MRLPPVVVAGHLTPPWAGLAGAALVVAGKSWSLLWVAIVLLAWVALFWAVAIACLRAGGRRLIGM